MAKFHRARLGSRGPIHQLQTRDLRSTVLSPSGFPFPDIPMAGGRTRRMGAARLALSDHDSGKTFGDRIVYRTANETCSTFMRGCKLCEEVQRNSTRQTSINPVSTN